MANIDYQPYYDFLNQHVISPFYEERLAKLNKLKLTNILKRKNPYLFKAKNIATAEEFVRSILDAYLSSQEETIFGGLFEKFAIHISERLYGGKKIHYKSLDLYFERDNTCYLVGIKSGPNWGNADQISQMKTSFKLAKIKFREKDLQKQVIAVNGCIYGKDNNPFKQDADPDKSYFKYCGQDFWNFISGDDELYKEIIMPIDREARKKDDVFKQAYTGKVNEMTNDFIQNFITNHQIDWLKLVDFVSKRQENQHTNTK
jgi:site-specific DNA-methyltransferase (cytosine-N4-specific)